MHARPIRFAIAILFATAAWGQSAAGRVFTFTYALAPIDIQQITNAVRTMGENTQVTLDTATKTLTVNGTPQQIAMAAWVFSALDQAAPANYATQEFRPAGSVNDLVRVMYLSHAQTPQSLQEIVNSVRTIPEMSKVFPYSAQNAVVIRGSDNQVAMTEWLFHQLDLPAGLQPALSSVVHQYATPGVANDKAQVLFLTHPWSPQSLQQITNTLRVISQLTKVFPCTAIGAVSVRGAATTVALAAWLFNQLDQAPLATPPAPQEYQMPGGADDVTQVFYLAPGTSAESLQDIVAEVRPAVDKHAFPNSALNAVTLRGTAAQIAAADALIRR